MEYSLQTQSDARDHFSFTGTCSRVTFVSLLSTWYSQFYTTYCVMSTLDVVHHSTILHLVAIFNFQTVDRLGFAYSQTLAHRFFLIKNKTHLWNFWGWPETEAKVAPVRPCNLPIQFSNNIPQACTPFFAGARLSSQLQLGCGGPHIGVRIQNSKKLLNQPCNPRQNSSLSMLEYNGVHAIGNQTL